MTSITCRAKQCIIALLVVLTFLAIPDSREIEAHAFLTESNPAANAILPDPPGEVRLRFTEPLEERFSQAELYDAAGNPFETEPSQVGDDPYEMILRLPADLPEGTYTVQWRNVSAADGHAQVGYVPFTVGNDADVTAVTVPDERIDAGVPIWAQAFARWLSLLGAVAAVGGVICWLLVVQPSVTHLPVERRAVASTYLKRLVGIGASTALAGSLLALIAQAGATSQSISTGSIADVLRETRYGTYWLLRIGFLLALAGIVWFPPFWRQRYSARNIGVVVLGVLLALLPFALVGHAAAQSQGRQTAIAADWLHLSAASVWIGGLVALLIGLIIGTRGIEAQDRRMTYAVAIQRFSTLAVGSVVILTFSGLYAAWLQVGNLSALMETDYGNVLVVKVALMLLMLTLGGLNQFIIGPRMLTAASNGNRFGRTVCAEVVLGIGVILAVGLLTSLPTARETLAAQAERATVEFEGNARLVLSPGATGLNQYTVDIDNNLGELPSDTELLLRVSHLGDIEGVREIRLNPTTGRRFTSSGRELSVVGDWNLELILRRPGQVDWRSAATIDVPAQVASRSVPEPAPRFDGFLAAGATLVLALAIVGLTVVARTSWRPSAMKALNGVSVAGLVIGVVVLSLTRVSDLQEEPSAAQPMVLSSLDVALTVQVRDYLQSAFGSPWQSASWYANLIDVAVVDRDVHVTTDLDTNSEAPITARNICRAVSNFNLDQLRHDPTVKDTLIDGITILARDGEVLYHAITYVDCV